MPRLTLSQYVLRRTGLPLGARGSLRAMLRRSLGAGTLAGFWRHWNPIWGFYLARWVERPLRRVAPGGVAIVATFLVSGAVHDVAVAFVRRRPTVLFTPWFGLVGLVVVVTARAGFGYDRVPWVARAGINLGLVFGCLGLVLYTRGLVP